MQPKTQKYFLPRARWIYILFVVGFAASALSGKCQRTLSSQALKAIELFEHKNYELSAEQFRRLMIRFPGDPLFGFYYAASLIELNQETDVAIELLKNSLDQTPLAEGYYYLGLAYYRQFKWDEAREAFVSARRLMNSRTKYSKEILNSLSNLEQRIHIIEKPTPYQGSAKITFPFDSLPQYLQQIRNLYLCPVNEEQQNYPGFVIGQKDTGFIAFYSAPSRNGNYNIFYKIRDRKNGTWRTEECSEQINSDADDILPVYDAVNHVLYFASNRSSGLGGYDIYRCNTDSTGRPLGTAQPLPFPINSPWNDYLYFPRDKTNAYLLSDRSCRLSNVILYDITINPTIAVAVDKETLSDRCFFRNTFAARNTSASNEKNVRKTTTETSYNNNDRISQIAKALTLQRTIDSLQIVNRSLRQQLDALPNDDNRKALYAQWKKNEEAIKSRQTEANSIYANILPDKTSVTADTLTRPNRINQFSYGNQPAYSAENPIPEQLNFPAGVIYTIQLGVFSKKVDPSFFGGIQPIVAEFLNDKKLIKYYAGVFSDYSIADSSLQIVKKAGFKEAFIVAYYDNKKIPLNRAQELEKNGEQ
jgi:tetratricopeptide (TPR) repeat protein